MSEQTQNQEQQNQPVRKNNSGCLKSLAIVLVTVMLSVGITTFILTQYIFPKRFTPVELSEKEQIKLEQKLSVFKGWGEKSSQERLEPETYRENPEDRLVALTERELNSMLANNTNLAHKFAIDLSDDLASGKLLIPLDPDFPIMGGKTLKISAGLELAYSNNRPIVILKGVSVMGIPIPNAWLGGLKNVDLISEFGDTGFWKAFSEGVDLVKVEEGKLVIKLKE